MDKTERSEDKPSRGEFARVAKLAVCAIALGLLASACDTQTAPSASATVSAAATAKPLSLQEGDTLRIAFPGAPNLDTTQTIRRDGKITLAQIGEYDAAGKTPEQVEADLKLKYASQLVNSEVTVTVEQSAFVIYVMGAVSRPGRLTSERPLNPLEALIEAGVDNTRSNLKSVWVIRTDSTGHTVKTRLNLYKLVHSESGQLPSFTLRPYDVIYVPERFSWY